MEKRIIKYRMATQTKENGFSYLRHFLVISTHERDFTNTIHTRSLVSLSPLFLSSLSLKPNDYGLFDMHGNVFEWCQEHHADYPNQPGRVFDDVANSHGVGTESRIIRGGGFHRHPGSIRSGARTMEHPSFAAYSIGFRVACTIP